MSQQPCNVKSVYEAEKYLLENDVFDSYFVDSMQAGFTNVHSFMQFYILNITKTSQPDSAFSSKKETQYKILIYREDIKTVASLHSIGNEDSVLKWAKESGKLINERISTPNAEHVVFGSGALSVKTAFFR